MCGLVLDHIQAVDSSTQYASNAMTPSTCLKYCSVGKTGPSQYAGLEYGRECWCGQELSDLSDKLNESSKCMYSCAGNSSEVCGGHLALTLYNLTSDDLKTGIAWSRFSGAAGYGTLALVTLMIAAAM